MVSQRSGEGECRPTRECAIHRTNRCTARHCRRLPGVRTEGRVQVQSPASGSRNLFEAMQVARLVNGLECLLGSEPARAPLYSYSEYFGFLRPEIAAGNLCGASTWAMLLT